MVTERLSFRRRLFVEAYLGEANGNATEAARMAGYCYPDKLGPRLVGKSGVSAAIDARVTEAALVTNEILARLSDHATATLDDFIRQDGDDWVVDLDKARRRGRLHCLKRLRRTKYGFEIELYDAQTALEKLGKYRGLWKDAAPPPCPPTVNVTITRKEAKGLEMAGE